VLFRSGIISACRGFESLLRHLEVFTFEGL
jgi:hypothetical protein